MLRGALSGSRVLWAADTAMMLAVRGLDRDATLVERIRDELGSVAPISHLAVDVAKGRIAVLFDDIAPLGEVVAALEQVELAAGVDGSPLPHTHHGSHTAPIAQTMLTATADVAAIGLALAGRLARAARLPIELAGLAPALQSQPAARRPLERVVGEERTEIALAFANAAAQAFAQGPLGVGVDLVARGLVLAELVERRRLWDREAPRILGSLQPAPLGELPVRDSPLHPSDADRYAGRAGLIGLGLTGTTFFATRDPRRAVAQLLALTPKAAQLGREGFAATLGRSLAARGVLSLDPTALRALDRIDTLVLDGELIDSSEADDQAWDEIVAAGRRCDLMVVVAGGGQRAGTFNGHLSVPGGEQLVDEVRILQRDGCGVAVVTADLGSLSVADCGIAVADVSTTWRADLWCPDLEAVRLIVDAIGVAHEVGRQSAAVALGASGAGSVVGLTAPAHLAATGAVSTVNVGALVALGNGIRAAHSLLRLAPPATQPVRPWHDVDIADVLEALGTSEDGLASATADGRRAPVPDEQPISFAAAVVEDMANPMTPVLAGAAAVAGAAGGYADVGLIAAVVLGNGLLGGAQRHRVERAVASLARGTDTPARVRRDGDVVTVPAGDVVPGDVVELETGDRVPADCRILRATDLEVEQASVTGEPLPVPKSADRTSAVDLADRRDMLYEGSSIATGSAVAVAVATGAGTELRRATVGIEPPESGVELRLRELARRTLPLAAAGSAAVLAGAIPRQVPMREGIETAVSLGVAAVPEGLPILATMAQLSAAQRLARKNALVRNSRAVEALGRVEVVCCDKTGTLTAGEITLHGVFDGERLVDAASLGPAHRHVVATAVRASPANGPNGNPLPHLTDRAIVTGAYASGISDVDGLADTQWERIAELPFESSRGYHAVLGRNGRGQLLVVKGAPEVLMPRCELHLTAGGSRALDDDARRELLDAVDDLAQRGFRMLAVAERPASSRQDLDHDRVERLTLLGFVALTDPVRTTAAAAVATMQRAGIRLVMLTGDHPSTAQGVAATLGLDDDRRVLTGPEIDAMDDEELTEALPEIAVFARVTPMHKARLVAAFQRRGQAVAMTGDGANDAPAIRLADVGIAFGPHSTPAARTAADVVVPDGKLETVVDAIIEGRALWVSVRDAIAVLVGGNVGEIVFTAVAGLGMGRSPLTARQLLLVNLLTDVLPAVAIATRPPRGRDSRQLLEEGPDRSLGRSLDCAIVSRAATTAAGATAAWSAGRTFAGPRRAGTIALVGLVGTQLGQTMRAGGRDPVILAASLGSGMALGAAVEVPGVSRFFGSTPLGPLGWAVGVGAATLATIASPLVDHLVAGVPGLHDRSPDPGAEVGAPEALSIAAVEGA